MESPLAGLVVICGAMFSGAFVAGLLLGTALGVIIPEGVRSIYVGAALEKAATKTSTESSHSESRHLKSAEVNHEEDHDHEAEEDHVHEHHSGNEHQERLLGWTLIMGFLTMMVADDVFASCTGTGPHGHSHGTDMMEESSSSVSTAKNDVEMEHQGENIQHVHDRHEAISVERRRNTVTLGLLIHNAMDGLAMGAAKSAMSSTAATQTVVFWAIMMHHVPASFGYATYLRNSGMEEHVVRRYVIIFSLAAPLAAALTFFALHPDFIGFYAVSQTAVGTCLLFSAGTFLNVACIHALEEAKRGFPKWGLRQALVLCLGACVPGLASWNHEH